MERRAASLTPDTFNAEARTVEVIFSTGADVQRGGYVERLAMTPDAVDLSRLVGAHVLDSHRKASLADVIGVVVSAEIRDGVGVAKIKFSERATAIIADVAAGIIRHISIGYAVQQWAESTDAKGQRVRTAVRWAPHEVSFVPVPADPGATTRSINMPELNTPEAPANTQTRAQINAAIRSLAETAGLDSAWSDSQIDAEATVEAARAAAFDAMATRATNIRVANPPAEGPEALVRNLGEALHARITGATPTDQARQYMGHTLADDARAILIARGQSVAGMSREAILERAMHTTTDFPNLLTGTGNRTLRAAYELAASPLKTLSRQTTAPDFRPINRLQVGEVGSLQKITESGEVQSVTRAEAKESYALETAAAMFSLTRKALVNDDLNAFGDWARAAGQQAAEYEAKVLRDLLESNPTMQDGKALFHADHDNLAGAPSVISGGTTMSDARKALRLMKGLDGVTPIAATPKYLLVHPTYETDAEKFLAEITAATTDDVNPFAGKLQLLVEPRLTSEGSWYVFADPAQVPCFEHAYLSGAQGPQIATREGWNTLGMEMRVVLDFGAGAIDWRGAYKVPGA
jgi:phage head maturation protease